MKVVINKCYGGFGLSTAAVKRYFEIQGWTLVIHTDHPEAGGMWEHYYRDVIDDDHYFSVYGLDRTDSVLIQVIEELGTDVASSDLAALKIVEIPDGVEWKLDEYDGQEWIAEVHRTWG